MYEFLLCRDLPRDSYFLPYFRGVVMRECAVSVCFPCLYVGVS